MTRSGEIEIPPRDVTDRFLANSGRRLDVVFNVDLGELIPGHHVVARGIERGRTFEPPEAGPIRVEEVDSLHFEHVPGLSGDTPTPDWGFTVSDDVGTPYVNDDSGSYDGHSGGAATHGRRNLGNIPPSASRLMLEIYPAHDWQPPEPWRHSLVIDLTRKVVAG